jgi:ribulose 1,5-bisphosphate synthetase/thiazole synthase
MMRQVANEIRTTNASAWTDTDMPKCSRLAGDIETEVCVVGAGIAGLTTSYLLAKEGQRVVLLDDGVEGVQKRWRGALVAAV